MKCFCCFVFRVGEYIHLVIRRDGVRSRVWSLLVANNRSQNVSSILSNFRTEIRNFVKNTENQTISCIFIKKRQHSSINEEMDVYIDFEDFG